MPQGCLEVAGLEGMWIVKGEAWLAGEGAAQGRLKVRGPLFFVFYLWPLHYIYLESPAL